jgi:hypothetical protein
MPMACGRIAKRAYQETYPGSEADAAKDTGESFPDVRRLECCGAHGRDKGRHGVVEADCVVYCKLGASNEISRFESIHIGHNRFLVDLAGGYYLETALDSGVVQWSAGLAIAPAPRSAKR